VDYHVAVLEKLRLEQKQLEAEIKRQQDEAKRKRAELREKIDIKQQGKTNAETEIKAIFQTVKDDIQSKKLPMSEEHIEALLKLSR
jgi:hypothetical protein